ncbi:MAG: endopeptidase La [Clostridia bacterium]|nr:endopeptidase La [Clostridia bacterium]
MGIYPVLALRGMPIFPCTVIHFEVSRDISIKAIEKALAADRKILVVAQTDPDIEMPQSEDLYTTGTVCYVKQILRVSDDKSRVLMEGLSRAHVIDYTRTYPYIECSAAEIVELKSVSDDDRILGDAYVRELKNVSAEYFSLSGRMPDEIDLAFVKEKDPSKFSDILSSALMLDIEQKQDLLDDLDAVSRLQKLLSFIHHEISVMRIEKEISAKTKIRLDDTQRDFYLREQLRVIHEELGDDEGIDEETDHYKKHADSLAMPENVREKFLKELERFYKMQPASPEATVIRNYLDWMLEIPWGVKSEEIEDMTASKDILENSHYGLEKVKERIIEFLAVRRLSKGKKSPVICLVGPPGVGKTSIAKAVAKSLGREYVRMSLGGIHDEAEIRGHRKTYIGAMPGRIVSAIKQAGSFNPLILLDEIDKVGADYRGNVSAALLEVLDTEQNFSFRDHYMECEVDLSDVLFFTTANSLENIDRPLLDRMEVIEVNGYTDEEKLQIAKKYIISKQLEENGLKKSQIKINDEAILDIIRYYTKESGVRELERKIASVMRKAANEIVTNGKKSMSASSRNLEKLLGRRIYEEPDLVKKDEVGVATGLAWTQYGGDTLSIEVNVMDGSGELELTGQLGDVMKESAKAAVTYIRSNAEKLGVPGEFHVKKDLHVHIPEGAVPKDGPSAGITMATAIVSALTGKKVSKKVAMTGEITITGRILPIGGLKEKSLAAYRNGIKTILIPKENMPDTYDLPEEIRKDINFVVADSMDTVLSQALRS